MDIAVDGERTVSGLLEKPEGATACLVLAHGAGAGMDHPFMAAVAAGLSERHVATLRFQFPYMQAGSKRPDRPALAQATVRAAAAAAARLMPDLPIFAGGKSFGGRMTSLAHAESPLSGVRGIVFLGFPLHPAKQPSVQRAEHLRGIGIPSIFLQGTRDALAEMDLLRPIIAGLGPSATLHAIEGADHSFHVPVKSGRTDAQVLDGMLDVLAAWIGAVAHR